MIGRLETSYFRDELPDRRENKHSQTHNVLRLFCTISISTLVLPAVLLECQQHMDRRGCNIQCGETASTRLIAQKLLSQLFNNAPTVSEIRKLHNVPKRRQHFIHCAPDSWLNCGLNCDILTACYSFCPSVAGCSWSTATNFADEKAD